MSTVTSLTSESLARSGPLPFGLTRQVAVAPVSGPATQTSAAPGRTRANAYRPSASVFVAWRAGVACTVRPGCSARARVNVSSRACGEITEPDACCSRITTASGMPASPVSCLPLRLTSFHTRPSSGGLSAGCSASRCCGGAAGWSGAGFGGTPGGAASAGGAGSAGGGLVVLPADGGLAGGVVVSVADAGSAPAATDNAAVVSATAKPATRAASRGRPGT
jgi:hypothetical protein